MFKTSYDFGINKKKKTNCYIAFKKNSIPIKFDLTFL